MCFASVFCFALCFASFLFNFEFENHFEDGQNASRVWFIKRVNSYVASLTLQHLLQGGAKKSYFLVNYVSTYNTYCFLFKGEDNRSGIWFPLWMRRTAK